MSERTVVKLQNNILVEIDDISDLSNFDARIYTPFGDDFDEVLPYLIGIVKVKNSNIANEDIRKAFSAEGRIGLNYINNVLKNPNILLNAPLY